MKNSFVLSLILLALVLTACNAPSTNAVVPTTEAANAQAPADSVSETLADPGTISSDIPADVNGVVESVLPNGLSTTEADALLFMREEEKLAHDVYLKMYEVWGMPIFQNIASSEQTHTDAVKTLIDGYGLTDPYSNEAGVFTNQVLQELYNQLVDQGSRSLADAIKVGGAIEEIDIIDLEERIAQTDKADIILVYENLLQGSRNHLRSFVSTLQTQTGETYQPQYMNLEAYQAVVSGAMETGGPEGKGNGNGIGKQ